MSFLALILNWQSNSLVLTLLICELKHCLASSRPPSCILPKIHCLTLVTHVPSTIYAWKISDNQQRIIPVRPRREIMTPSAWTHLRGGPLVMILPWKLMPKAKSLCWNARVVPNICFLVWFNYDFFKHFVLSFSVFNGNCLFYFQHAFLVLLTLLDSL